jgi:hypothetical protein
LFDRISPHITMPVLLASNLVAFGLLLVLILPLRNKVAVKNSG